MNYIKNIQQETTLYLANEVSAVSGQIVSKTLAQNPFVTMTLFAFAKGEEISVHTSDGDAMVLVLEGCGQFTVDGSDYVLAQGQTLVMPAKKPHAVFAKEAFKMLLTVIFPSETPRKEP